MAQRLDKTVLLPEAHFILEADLDRGRRRKFAHGLRNTSGKVFLNATIACASSSPYWVLAASRQLLLAGDSTRDYESGGQEFESLRARTFGTVVLAEPGRYCAQPCHTLIASLSNTACAGAPLLYRFRTGRQTANVPCTSKISATRLATPRRICLIGGIRRENRSGPMATGKQLKAAILARRAAKGPRKKRTRPKPRQYTIADLERARDRVAAAERRIDNDRTNNPNRGRAGLERAQLELSVIESQLRLRGLLCSTSIKPE